MLSTSLVARIRTTAVQHGTFTLPSGDVLDEYFDQYLLAADPALLREVAGAMARELPADTEVVVGLALGGVPLAVALAAAANVQAAFFRNEPKAYGTRRQIEAGTVADRRVVVVDDVVRTGSQILKAARILRRMGAAVSSAICVLDRDLGGCDRLAAEDVELRSVLTPSTLGSTEQRRWVG
ncbi:orotate phosphoribosyltransferase [Nocardia blacklockiae]|uniref:orotate phosphoribosyltransferase n=1 Tax=Nocardia blacklockiae TaxID=480036 RepID=UPI001E65CB41|nr:orotate phosphoribosyltransferase [Nocardia blacklockiae]